MIRGTASKTRPLDSVDLHQQQHLRNVYLNIIMYPLFNGQCICLSGQFGRGFSCSWIYSVRSGVVNALSLKCVQ